MTATHLPAARWRLYSVEEAMAILRVSRATLYRRVKAGMPHHNIDGLGVKFTDDDFTKIFEKSARGVR